MNDIKFINLNNNVDLNNITDRGIYEIKGYANQNTSLPVGRLTEEYVNGLLIVLDNSNTSKNVSITQFLILSSTSKNMYIRKGVGDINNIIWDNWAKALNSGTVDDLSDIYDMIDELSKRLQGISENTNPLTDPFKFLGEFENISELINFLDDFKQNKGEFRALVNNNLIIINSNVIAGIISQTIRGSIILNADNSIAPSSFYNEYRRIYFMKWMDWSIINKEDIEKLINSEVKNLKDSIDNLFINDGIELYKGALGKNSDPDTNTPYGMYSNKILANGEKVVLAEGFKFVSYKVFEGDVEIFYYNLEGNDLILEKKGCIYQLGIARSDDGSVAFTDFSKVIKSFIRKSYTWGDTSNLNNFTPQGRYTISGERKVNAQDNMPIINGGKVEAVLDVLAKDNCITQILTLLNVSGGDGNIYIRNRKDNTWTDWQCLSGGGTDYTLPVATADNLGGVKVTKDALNASGLMVNNGQLSLNQGGVKCITPVFGGINDVRLLNIREGGIYTGGLYDGDNVYPLILVVSYNLEKSGGSGLNYILQQLTYIKDGNIVTFNRILSSDESNNTIAIDWRSDVDTPVVNQISTTATIAPNVLNVWGEVAELDITFTEGKAGVVNEYIIQFTSGETPTALALPREITWISVPNIQANKTYQVSIINNLGVIGEFNHE